MATMKPGAAIIPILKKTEKRGPWGRRSTIVRETRKGRTMRARFFLIGSLLLAAAAIAAADQTVMVAPGGTLTFSPDPITIAPGETVTWVWAVDAMLHTTTSDAATGPEVWDSGPQSTLGFQYPHTFNTVGSYTYHCFYHQLLGMTGTINVVIPTPTPTPTETPTPTATPTATLTPTLTPTPTPPIGRDFFSVPPCRAINTRTTDVPALVAGATRTFVLATGAPVGNCTIPVTAKAVSINVTITQPDADGDLRLYPGGLSPPLASTINYRTGQTRANNAIVSLGASGDVTVKCDQAFGAVQLIIDVNGYTE
jgi:plastocyanin